MMTMRIDSEDPEVVGFPVNLDSSSWTRASRRLTRLLRSLTTSSVIGAMSGW